MKPEIIQLIVWRIFKMRVSGGAGVSMSDIKKWLLNDNFSGVSDDNGTYQRVKQGFKVEDQ